MKSFFFFFVVVFFFFLFVFFLFVFFFLFFFLFFFVHTAGTMKLEKDHNSHNNWCIFKLNLTYIFYDYIPMHKILIQCTTFFSKTLNGIHFSDAWTSRDVRTDGQGRYYMLSFANGGGIMNSPSCPIAVHIFLLKHTSLQFINSIVCFIILTVSSDKGIPPKFVPR